MMPTGYLALAHTRPLLRRAPTLAPKSTRLPSPLLPPCSSAPRRGYHLHRRHDPARLPLRENARPIPLSLLLLHAALRRQSHHGWSTHSPMIRRGTRPRLLDEASSCQCFFPPTMQRGRRKAVVWMAHHSLRRPSLCGHPPMMKWSRIATTDSDQILRSKQLSLLPLLPDMDLFKLPFNPLQTSWKTSSLHFLPSPTRAAPSERTRDGMEVRTSCSALRAARRTQRPAPHTPLLHRSPSHHSHPSPTMCRQYPPVSYPRLPTPRDHSPPPLRPLLRLQSRHFCPQTLSKRIGRRFTMRNI